MARYKCKSELYGADMLLDINSEVYRMELNTRYTIRVAQTIVPDVSKAKDSYDAVRCSRLFSANCTDRARRAQRQGQLRRGALQPQPWPSRSRRRARDVTPCLRCDTVPAL